MLPNILDRSHRQPRVTHACLHKATKPTSRHMHILASLRPSMELPEAGASFTCTARQSARRHTSFMPPTSPFHRASLPSPIRLQRRCHSLTYQAITDRKMAAHSYIDPLQRCCCMTMTNKPPTRLPPHNTRHMEITMHGNGGCWGD